MQEETAPEIRQSELVSINPHAALHIYYIGSHFLCYPNFVASYVVESLGSIGYCILLILLH
jgi:hypothetical protein